MDRVIPTTGLFILVNLVLHIHNVTSQYTRPRLVSYSIPDKRELKKSLGYLEDTYLNFTELTNKYNYPSEEHRVTTEDGYILTVFRILSKCSGTKGVPVVLMHGITDTSDQWILTGPRTGLGYILSDNCYDVWTANHRGNFYSRKHVTLNPDKDPEYWNYTFDEHGNFDLPAIIDYVLSSTQKPQVSYVGHSQGTTDFFVMGSLRPEYNDKIRISFHLSPVTWLKNIKSPIPRLLAPQSTLVKDLLEGAGFYELFGKHQLSHTIVEFFCQFAPDDICGTAYSISIGYIRGHISSRNLAISFGHLLSGISTKDLVHFGQLVATGRFQRYDEGKEGNIKRYGTKRPPQYDVTKVTSAVVLICAQNDWLSSLKDIEILKPKLPNLVESYLVPDPYWSHNDQVYGVNAPKYVFPKILEYLDKYNS